VAQARWLLRRGARRELFVLLNCAAPAALAQAYAKYLMLLPGCVTSSANVLRPKIRLANPTFAVQHLSRDTG
jgi:hypothetical protein